MIVLSPRLTVRAYFPPTANTNGQQLLPVGLYFHGGGWCCGDLDSEDNFCRMLAKTLPAVVVWFRTDWRQSIRPPPKFVMPWILGPGYVSNITL